MRKSDIFKALTASLGITGANATLAAFDDITTGKPFPRGPGHTGKRGRRSGARARTRTHRQWYVRAVDGVPCVRTRLENHKRHGRP